MTMPFSALLVTADELRAFCRNALAAFKVPQRPWFVPRDALPLTASGKVQKHLLRAMLVAEAAPTPDDGSVPREQESLPGQAR